MKPLDFGGTALIWGLDRNPVRKKPSIRERSLLFCFPALIMAEMTKGQLSQS